MEIKRDLWGQRLVTHSAGLKCSTEYQGPAVAGSYSRRASRGVIDDFQIITGPAWAVKRKYPDARCIGHNKWKV